MIALVGSVAASNKVPYVVGGSMTTIGTYPNRYVVHQFISVGGQSLTIYKKPMQGFEYLVVGGGAGGGSGTAAGAYNGGGGGGSGCVRAADSLHLPYGATTITVGGGGGSDAPGGDSSIGAYVSAPHGGPGQTGRTNPSANGGDALGDYSGGAGYSGAYYSGGGGAGSTGAGGRPPYPTNNGGAGGPGYSSSITGAAATYGGGGGGAAGAVGFGYGAAGGGVGGAGSNTPGPGQHATGPGGGGGGGSGVMPSLVGYYGGSGYPGIGILRYKIDILR